MACESRHECSCDASWSGIQLAEISSPPTPHAEDLLVLYVGDQRTVGQLLSRLAMTPIASENPFWDQVGVSVCDPDGFRVILVGRPWP